MGALLPRDVFISYKNEDRQAADSICAALESENISCWMAPRDITAGQEWAVAIVQALQSSKTFVLLLSAHSRNARQIAREAELADRQNLPLITFRLEDVEPPPELLYFVGNVQWLDGFSGNFDSAVKKLAEFVRSYCKDKKAGQVYAFGSAVAAPRSMPAAPVNLTPSAAPSDAGASTGGNVRSDLRFDPERLEDLVRDLAPYVGPMAKVLVKRAAKDAKSWKQLYDALALEIPDSAERRKFLSKRPV
ncbi:MAG: toll/interleukin-1 receptor domain-containing protein [Acidobacteriaceae bacterium]|nr:toll/interleukin-1 receptor domain-containing protein [Acidobacteriaceae bacterium]MBV9503307.1 toll/interleukin-1 receptor domain-containing protein [Acidobacteriaceae bacterium]